MARILEPTFSTVKVTPTHSPPAGAVKNTEPFMKPTQPATASSEFPGSDSSAVKHQSTSETKTHRPRSSEHTGTDSSAAKHQSTIQLTHRPGSSSSERTGTDFSAVKHQSTSKLQSSRPHTDQPSDPTGTDSPTLHRSRKDSISSLSSEAVSEVSDQPPLDLRTCGRRWVVRGSGHYCHRSGPVHLWRANLQRDNERYSLFHGLVARSRHGQFNQHI